MAPTNADQRPAAPTTVDNAVTVDTAVEVAVSLAEEPPPVEVGTPSRPVGPTVIAAYVKRLPASPGVYRMLDEAGEVLYVGKARSLKARVSNYARLGGHTNRIARMIAATASMEFVTVRTEAEALLLEANLIKRFRPRFNVLMRDDKSFPYILLARDHAAPQLVKHRGARNRKGDYFGPFASAGAVNRAVNTLQRAFLLRSCTDSVYEARTRPCLLHQIKRCSGPCTGEIALDDYARLVEQAVDFLRGDSEEVRERLKGMMLEASDALEFERAAQYRNRLQAIAHVTADQAINPDGIEEADVFGAYQDGGQTCIQVFFFRTGQNWGNRAYFPKADRSLAVGEVLESFIAQFYDDKPVPRLILTSQDFESRALLAEALSIKADRRTEVRVPQRGGKMGIVEHAVQNAKEALGRKLAETSSQRRLLEGIAERFGLPRVPRRVEVFDNSHIMGASAVGAMIVAGPEGLVKGQYRKFNIKGTGGAAGDDYAMMREVLARRFKRLVEAGGADDSAREDQVDRSGTDGADPPIDPADVAAEDVAADDPDLDDDADSIEEFPDRPDLVLVDGGLGQLTVAREVLDELGIVDVALVGVAKGPDRDAGREHFHLTGRERPIMLEPRDPVLYFVQRLRDEAHRFAIGTHRAKRAKALGANPLDDITGIGASRKRALLQHFGSAKGVSRAGVEDLMAVKGVSAQLARKIYDYFHECAE